MPGPVQRYRHHAVDAAPASLQGEPALGLRRAQAEFRSGHLARAAAITRALLDAEPGVSDPVLRARLLNQHGIFHFDQIASWTKADIAAAEAYLAFDGRIAREDWVGQARTLARNAKSGVKKA